MTSPAPHGHVRIFINDGNCIDVILVMPWHEAVAFYLQTAMFQFLGGFVERKNIVRVHQVQITGQIEDAASVGLGGGNQSLN